MTKNNFYVLIRTSEVQDEQATELLKKIDFPATEEGYGDMLEEFRSYAEALYFKTTSPLPLRKFQDQLLIDIFSKESFPQAWRLATPGIDIVLNIINMTHEKWLENTDFKLLIKQLKEKDGN